LIYIKVITYGKKKDMVAKQSIQLQKEVKFNPKQPSCKKACGPKEGHCEI